MWFQLGCQHGLCNLAEEGMWDVAPLKAGQTCAISGPVTTNLQRALAQSKRKPERYFIYPSLSPFLKPMLYLQYTCNTIQALSEDV